MDMYEKYKNSEVFSCERLLYNFLTGNYYPFNEEESEIIQSYVSENGEIMSQKLLSAIEDFLNDRRFTDGEKKNFISKATCNISGIDNAIVWLIEVVKNPLEIELANL